MKRLIEFVKDQPPARLIALGFAAVILLLSLLVIWGKHKNKYSLEWFLGAVTRRSASS